MNCFKSFIGGCFLCLGFVSHSQAQNKAYLSPERVLEIALLNHFDVYLAKTEVKKAELANNLGNAGITPEIDLTGGYGGSNRNLRQLFVSGNEVNQNNVSTSEFNYALNLSWTLFDGYGMFARKKALGEQVHLKEWELKQKIQELTIQVLSIYYLINADYVLLQSMQSLKNAVKTRLDFSQDKLEKGMGNRQDWLLAKMEWQRLENECLELETKIKNNKVTLLSWMGETQLQTDFDVAETIVINETLLGTFVSNTSQNPEIKGVQSQLMVSEWMLKNAKGAMLPQIRLGSSYTGIRAESEAGFLLQNRNNGLNYGITARMPLFAGGQYKAELRHLDLDNQVAWYQLKFATLRLDADEIKAYQTLKTYFAISNTEKVNIELASELMLLQKERLAVGVVTAIESKEAERVFEESNYRLTRALYLAKMAELELLRARGALLK